MIHSGKWIFIRFNPDSNVSKVDLEDKLDTLIKHTFVKIFSIKFLNDNFLFDF